MITRQEKIRVGIFVVATASILLAFLGALWGIKASKSYKRFYILTKDSVGGLSPSAPVKYLGVDTGRVERMEIEPEEGTEPPKIRITIAVGEETPMKEDTRAQLTPQGITGIQYIELVRGTSAKPLKPGSEVKFVPSEVQDILMNVQRISRAADVFLGENKQKLTKTIEDADALLVQATGAITSGQTALERVSARVETLLDENRLSVREVLDRASVTLKDVQGIVTQLKDKGTIDEVASAVSDVRKVIAELDRAVKDVHGQVSQAALGDAIADLRSTATAATGAANSARELVSRLGPRADEDLEATSRLLEQLQRTARGLEDVAHEIKERPSLLVRDLERHRRPVPDR
ncbi:MCE family protein [bacterium]|nr:MCE family protein [bacterium]